MKKIIAVIILVSALFSAACYAEQVAVKVLVSSPQVSDKVFNPIADVFAGSLVRELLKTGTAEVIPRERSEEYLANQGREKTISTRDVAIEVGTELGANIVIFSTLERKYDSFIYTISLVEVERDILQREIHGAFPATASPAEIGRVIKNEFSKLSRYVPLPSEIIDPGGAIRDISVDPMNLPKESIIENFPKGDRYGVTEQLFSYFRVFPGESEYKKFDQEKVITRLIQREDLDPELTAILNGFYMLGDFAIRNNLQAYLIKNCSSGAINLLLANKVPVIIGNELLLGYTNLRPDGFCIFEDIEKKRFEPLDLSERQYMTVMFVVPRPGKRLGLSKEYLEKALKFFKDGNGNEPKLIEVKESILDIIPASLD